MEIIERKIKADVINENRCLQISYNSDGRLVLRFFDVEQPNKDRIISFTSLETIEIIDFIKRKMGR